ncbi:hypothetical protein GGI1_00135 [Acidithiobacillus sp. GGI-221]|nr:hypothetical protein GGI1_00135 [Acidithiobacillus sp. GGI-221]
MSDRDSKLARAMRRHHRYRLYHNRRFHWGRDLAESDENPKTRGRVVNTPTPCSCWMCGNPRRHFGEKTLQELRQDEADGLRKIKKPYFGS